MKAIVLESFGDVSSLKEKEILDPHPKKEEVRIRMKASGFNPVDTKIRKGEYGGKAGIVLGADGAGIVDEVGEGAKFSKGDEVYFLGFGQGSNGTNAEYVCIDCNFVYKKPKNLSFEEAATLPIAGLTAFQLALKGKIQKGESIFIAGASGAVGKFLVQIAINLEAEIFSTAGNEESAKSLTDLGIKKENILFYRDLTLEQMTDRLIQMNKGRFLKTFDCVGGDMKKLCLLAADFEGSVLSIVPEKKGFDFDLWARGESIAFQKNLSVHFIFIGAEAFNGQKSSWMIYQELFRGVTELVEERMLKISPPQVLKGLSAENVQKAHRLIEEGKAKSKIVMSFG